MSKITNLPNKGKVTYIANFLTKTESDTLFNDLKKSVPWTQGTYNMFGKPVKTPRLLYAMREKDTDITKSYSVTESIEWTPLVKKIKEKIEKETGKTILYAQLNYYRNGNDYIGYHADKEVQPGDIIASISLGATRQFVLRHKDYKENKIKKQIFDLKNGSLIIMDEDAAKNYWKHSLPKMPKLVAPRINITFRPK